MSVHGPLVLLQSRYHDPDGIAPSELLVESIKDAGFTIAALADHATLRGAPAFLDACRKSGIHPLVGTTLPVGPDTDGGIGKPIDVLSLQDSLTAPTRIDREPAALIATNRRGYRNLLTILDRLREMESDNMDFETLLANKEGLFLIVGIPGSPLSEVVAGHRPWSSISWIEPLLKGWSKARLAFGGLYPLHDEFRIARILTRLKQLPVALAPIALTVAAYRNENERFWGMARSGNPLSLLRPGERPMRLVENREALSRNLQGLSRAVRQVERLAIRESDLSETLDCPPPIYPTPRGTDTNSFFWTLVQEAAISTGHIRTPGGKERLYEEYQYLKQTPWPGLWLILWDLRRRLGLPPGTLRPTDDWICTSLSAHLLGLVRVDPLRERIGFLPSSGDNVSSQKGLRIEVEAPLGFEHEIGTAATALLGEGRTGICELVRKPLRAQLTRRGREILNRWEELGFTGDRPSQPPPLPAYIPEESERSPLLESNLLLSSAPLGYLFSTSKKGFPYLEVDLDDATRLGGTVLRFRFPTAQTLASAPRYRGEPEAPVSPLKRGAESITDWIEEHRGEMFYGEAYADDTGKLEMLGHSSCLLRLMTYPSSISYRPILSEWIRRAAPRNLGTLANLLALGWHWTFWSGRRDWKTIAVGRRNPLLSEEDRPPWWPEWEQFLESSGLESRLAGSFGAAFEKATEPTGGWLLFHEQLRGALEEGLGLPAGETERWLHFEEVGEGADYSDRDRPNLWGRNLRRLFRFFLGGVARFPSRTEFLKKAETLLSAAEGFHRDPLAATALLSFLVPEEGQERRELYEILKERGATVALPILSDPAPFDRSWDPEVLSLGLLNVQEIGPKTAAKLAPGWGAYHENPKRLFEEPKVSAFSFWDDWLAAHTDRPVDWKCLTRLIQMGICDGFGESRASLVEKTRGLLRKRSESSAAVQETLFGLSSATSSSEAEEEKAWNRCSDGSYPQAKAELDSLRVCAGGNPLSTLRDLIPAGWIEGIPSSDNFRWAWGWVHEVDVFESPHEEAGAQGGNVWMTFRLFGPKKSYRIVDRQGLLLEPFPETLPEDLGLEGRRIHLKTPWRLLCEIHQPKSPGSPEYETFDLVDAEPIEDIPPRSESWAGIGAQLAEATTELQLALEEILACFSHDLENRSVPLLLDVAPGVFRKGAIRRLAGRFGNVRVVGSALFTRSLGRLPGVEEVRPIPNQKSLFPQG